MIPTVSVPGVPAQLSSSAKETSESVSKAIKSLYSNALQCTDMASNLSIKLPSECHSGRDDHAVTLDWHNDPSASMSDLTLVIYDGSGGHPYHVHTLLLAFGGRRSGFVQEQLQQQQKNKRDLSANVKDYKIEVYVPPLAARHIPTFLDYIYGRDLKLSTASAPSLRYLSNRFDVRDLHDKITRLFIPRDLDLDTAPRYCMAADELKDYELREKALRIMAERMDKINSNFLKGFSPRMMRTLVQCDKVDCGGTLLSEKVADWLRCRDADGHGHGQVEGHSLEEATTTATNQPLIPLSDEDFYWITHVQQMPQISPREALFYLNYGAKYTSVMNEVGPGSLKHRCLAACSGSWAMDNLVTHLENPQQVEMDLYQKLDDHLKVQLLENAMVGAKKLCQEKARQSSQQEGVETDIALSNEIMYDNLLREVECPSMEKVAKVVVLGCGIHSANGVYIADSRSSLPPISPRSSSKSLPSQDAHVAYEKEAVWNGSRVTFLILPYKSGKYYSHYKLAVRQNNFTKVLYTSPTLTSGEGCKLLKVPEQGWEVEGEEEEERSIHPAPMFVGRIAQSKEE